MRGERLQSKSYVFCSMAAVLGDGMTAQCTCSNAAIVKPLCGRRSASNPACHPPAAPSPALPRSCVGIVAASALRAMIKPGLLAVAAPCVVGVAFRALGAATGQAMLGAKAVAGFLMFVTVAGALCRAALRPAAPMPPAMPTHAALRWIARPWIARPRLLQPPVPSIPSPVALQAS